MFGSKRFSGDENGNANKQANGHHEFVMSFYLYTCKYLKTPKNLAKQCCTYDRLSHDLEVLVLSDLDGHLIMKRFKLKCTQNFEAVFATRPKCG